MKFYAIVILTLALASCTTPDQNAGTRQIAAQRAAMQHPQVTPEIEAARAKLVNEYHELLTQVFPDYNDIDVHFLGNFLIAAHSMFTPYTFDVGPAGPAVKQWIAQHYAELRQARVAAVGLSSGIMYSTGVPL